MPAVGMRRSTRVFGARVLRSGRRLSTAEPGEVWKQQHQTRSAGNVEDDLIHILKNDPMENKKLRKEKNGRDSESLVVDDETKEMDVDEKTVERKDGKRWGAVYQRKRKGLDVKDDLDRKYGKQFSRQRVKRRRGSEAICQVEITRTGVNFFAVFLNSILSYMSRVNVTLQQLSAFLLSEPICSVYNLHGIHFLQDSTSSTSSGVCRITGSRCSVPMFALNYAALPSVFMFLHTSLLVRSATLPIANGVEVNNDGVIDDEEIPSHHTCELDNIGGETGAAVCNTTGKRRAVPWGAATPKLGARTYQLRSVNSRSIQKRRSSLRLRRGRNLSSFVVRKAVVGHPQNAISFRNNGLPFFPVKSNQEIISPVREISTRNSEELKSMEVATMEDLDASSCSANILVIEADKCYREQRATITLDCSASNQWVVRIKTNGTREYNFMAEKVMRPCSFNRITRATVWTTDNGWKLEFSNSRDWLIFKRLYAECFDRNVQGPTVSGIPVPCVVEVSSYVDSNYVPFSRPESYIRCEDDELTRALGRGSASYDMDSDDEVWLNRFNVENVFNEPISADVFELIISSFEKSLFCAQDDYLDVKSAVDPCISLERREVLEAMHSYWIKKRKQKRLALVKVFQYYQPRRTQVLTKAILRKKRSFNRQASKIGRGKQRASLEGMAAERDSVDEQKNILKVQEAGAAAYRSDDLAVRKRKRAQLLMEVADKCTYKATMALRISEALGQGKLLTDVAKIFLG